MSVALQLSAEQLEQLAGFVADRLAERLRSEPALLSASQVAARFGVSRGWVYDHAQNLGAIPLGTGPRARLRFDVQQVERTLRNNPPEATAPAPVASTRRQSTSSLSTTASGAPLLRVSGEVQ